MMDKFITDKARGLVLWRRLRVSYYVNTVILVLTFLLVSQLQQVKGDDGWITAILVFALIVSHLNYHYHLEEVARFIGKSTNWYFLSLITFPVGPLLSYHAIKPAAMRSGIPI